RRSLGERNSIEDVRNYVVGLGEDGLLLAQDGTLDMQRSFRRIDYFAALSAIHVRNNLQKGVSDRPVDFIAAEQNGSVHVWKNNADASIERRADGELRYTPDIFGLKSGLDGWHTEREWLNATHRSEYSNIVIGLAEEMLSDPAASQYLE